MAAMPYLCSEEQAVFDNFVKAASYLTGCVSAILMKRDGARWSVVSTYGAPSALSINDATDGWLKMALSYGDVVDISDVVPRNSTRPMGLEPVTSESLVCAAIRDPIGDLTGVVLIMTPPPHKRLSAAQIYGLQTHANDLAYVLQRNLINASTDLGAIERLRLLESVIVHAKDAILITESEPIDLPGPRIVYCNPAFLVTTGFSLDEVMGKTPRILQCEETNRETLQQIREALEQWKPIEVELINARRDGSRFWVQLSIVPVANEKGGFTHWVSVQSTLR